VHGAHGYYALRPMLPEVSGDGTVEPVIEGQYSSADNVMDRRTLADYLAARIPGVAEAAYLHA
jgi:hypothetical protein